MRWRFGGLSLLGLSFLTTGGNSYPAVLKAKDASVIAGARVRVRTLTVRLLQPQLQLLLWRLAFNVQAGFGGRATVYLPGNEQDILAATARWQVDPLLELQGRLRFTVVGGLYLEGSYRHSRPLGNDNAAINSLEGGLGYAF